jgi:hypothetical protein
VFIGLPACSISHATQHAGALPLATGVKSTRGMFSSAHAVAIFALADSYVQSSLVTVAKSSMALRLAVSFGCDEKVLGVSTVILNPSSRACQHEVKRRFSKLSQKQKKAELVFLSRPSILSAFCYREDDVETAARETASCGLRDAVDFGQSFARHMEASCWRCLNGA